MNRKDKKKLIGVLLAVFALLLIKSNVFLPFVGIVGFGTTLVGGVQLLYAWLRHRDYRIAVGVLFFGIVLFSFAWEFT